MPAANPSAWKVHRFLTTEGAALMKRHGLRRIGGPVERAFAVLEAGGAGISSVAFGRRGATDLHVRFSRERGLRVTPTPTKDGAALNQAAKELVAALRRKNLFSGGSATVVHNR